MMEITITEHYSHKDNKNYGPVYETDLFIDDMHVVTYGDHECERIQGFMDAINYIFVDVEITHKRVADK